MSKRKHKLLPGDWVLVEWYDACAATTAWQDNIEIHPCTSIGFLVKKDKKQIVIAHTIAEDGQYAGMFAIPSGFIKKFKIVK